MIRSICSLLVMVLVVKDGTCRQPGRTIPALVGAEDGLERHLEDTANYPNGPYSGPQPPKDPETPRVRRSAPLPLGYVMARSMGAPVPRYMGEEPSDLRSGRQDFARQYPPPPMPPMPPMVNPIPEIPIFSGASSSRIRRSPKKDKKKPTPPPEPEPEEEEAEEEPEYEEETEEPPKEKPGKGKGRDKKKSKLRDRRSPKKPEEKPEEEDEENPEENPEKAMKH